MTTHFCIVCVIVMICLTVFYAEKMARMTSPAHLSARRISARKADLSRDSLPDQWSWQNVSERDAKLWTSLMHRKLAIGTYTSPVINQHRSRWCGCCYMVAALQMIQDRVHIFMGSGDYFDGPMTPYIEFDAQVALNKYDKYQRLSQHKPWNACRGGDPLKVLQAIQLKSVPLLIVPGMGFCWVGHPVVDTATYDVNHTIDIKDARKIEDLSVDNIKREIFTRGPVVLGINAEYMKMANGGGYLPADVNVQSRNHAVSVVGWRKTDGVEYWVLRNSWGKTHVPENKPSDVTCVSVGENSCDVKTEQWKSDFSNPGYVYAPLMHPHFFEEPSPWYAADV